MKLTAAQREVVRMKFGGHCAYCGTVLTEKWHADHVKPVQRVTHYDHKTRSFKATGVSHHPERDHIDNLMPACVPCNIDKHDLSLEYWRKQLEDSAARLHRNYSTYRHARRFGLITEQAPRVVFWFENYRVRKPWRPHADQPLPALEQQ